jgi:hypothetical protein
MALAQYAGYESESDPALVAPPPPSEDAIARRTLEAENRDLRKANQHLKEVVRALESALKVAGRVLQPYLCR